ncbi:MAG: hypothetical protein ACJAVS_000858, partial [Paracoccaceae bacterium]
MTAPADTPSAADARGPDLDTILNAEPPRRGRTWLLSGVLALALGGGIWLWQAGPKTPIADLYDL